MKFYPATITALNHVTHDAISISLSIPDAAYEHFDYKAGQHLTIAIEIDGQELRRSYSLNSSPSLEEELQITIKRVKGGRVSNYMHDQLKEGDILNVSTPIGSFKPDISEKNHKSYYLFAAGSGITPVWSITKTILAVEPWSYIYLLYGNRNEENIILDKEIRKFQTDYTERFFVEHILSDPISHQWTALFKSIENWKGMKGRIDATTIQDFINRYPPQAQNAQYFICGPGNMIPSVRNALLDLDVADSDILFEYFGAPEDLSHTTIKSTEALLTVQLNGSHNQLQVKENQNLLEAMLDNHIDAPYSCQSGVCGQCKAHLESGEVQMKSNMALNEKEIKQGSILTCQSYAKTPSIIIKY